MNEKQTTMNMAIIEHSLYRKLFPEVPFSKMIADLISSTGKKGGAVNKNYAFQMKKEDVEKLDRICKDWKINHSEYLRNSLWIAILKKLANLPYDEIQKTVLDIIPNETIE